MTGVWVNPLTRAHTADNLCPSFWTQCWTQQVHCVFLPSTPFAKAPIIAAALVSASSRAMSALPPKADIERHYRHVCFVPKADIIPPKAGIRTLLEQTR